MRYRRADAAGATYSFTVDLAGLKRDLLVQHIDSRSNTIMGAGRRIGAFRPCIDMSHADG